MLTHQSNVDAATCLFAIILLVQPSNWIPGVYILDTIIFHLWNGQFIYLYAVFISGNISYYQMQMQMCFIEDGLIPSALSLFSVQLIKPVHVTHFPQTKFTLDMPYIFDESKDGGRP